MLEISGITTELKLYVVYLKPIGVDNEIAVEIDISNPPTEVRRPEGAGLGAFFYAHRAITTLTVYGEQVVYGSPWIRRSVRYYIDPKAVTAEMAAGELSHIPLLARSISEGYHFVLCRGGMVYPYDADAQTVYS